MSGDPWDSLFRAKGRYDSSTECDDGHATPFSRHLEQPQRAAVPATSGTKQERFHEIVCTCVIGAVAAPAQQSAWQNPGRLSSRNPVQNPVQTGPLTMKTTTAIALALLTLLLTAACSASPKPPCLAEHRAVRREPVHGSVGVASQTERGPAGSAPGRPRQDQPPPAKRPGSRQGPQPVRPPLGAVAGGTAHRRCKGGVQRRGRPGCFG